MSDDRPASIGGTTAPAFDPTDVPIVGAWRSALSRPEVTAALEFVYTDVSRRVEERGPACWASGRCCNFARAGHRLYVTGLEAIYAITRAPASSPPLTALSLADAIARGGCPFQTANLCGTHPSRPLGCRVYFCDRSAKEWQIVLAERSHAAVKAIHDTHGVPYRYGEWRAMLGLVLAAEIGLPSGR